MSNEKTSLRDEARARRAGLARDVPGYARRAAQSFVRLALPPDAVLAGYMPIRDEADPREIMKLAADRGHTLALPSIDNRRSALVFRRWKSGDQLHVNRFGIGEPERDAELVTPGIVLVPFLAFDNSGHRLGYGGGYYDRTLAALREKGHVLAIGVGFAGQEVPVLPRHEHDHSLDLVVTELGIRRFR
jgi:5-formyltetrahydrofolate cyclo-ligase